MKKNSFISGIIVSTVVFVGGYFISQLIWKYIDKGYGHGPGLSHLFLLLLFFFCIGWLIRGIIKRKDKNWGFFWKGSACMNFCFIVFPIIYLITTINDHPDLKNGVPEQSITIEKYNRDTMIYRRVDWAVIDSVKKAQSIEEKAE